MNAIAKKYDSGLRSWMVSEKWPPFSRNQIAHRELRNRRFNLKYKFNGSEKFVAGADYVQYIIDILSSVKVPHIAIETHEVESFLSDPKLERNLAIQNKIDYFKKKLKSLPLKEENSIEVHYGEEDEAIFGSAKLKKDMYLSIAYDVDDLSEKENIIVFTLFQGDDLLLSNICTIDVLINHINKYL